MILDAPKPPCRVQILTFVILFVSLVTLTYSQTGQAQNVVNTEQAHP